MLYRIIISICFGNRRVIRAQDGVIRKILEPRENPKNIKIRSPGLGSGPGKKFWVLGLSFGFGCDQYLLLIQKTSQAKSAFQRVGEDMSSSLAP